MKLTRVLALGVLAAALGTAGCIKHKVGDLTGVRLEQVNPSAPDSSHNPPGPPDSTGNPGNPDPGPPPPPIPAQFVGSDSTHEGQTGNTYWRVGNDGGTATLQWRLQQGSGWSGASWPSLPIEGTLRVQANKTVDLTVPLPVPSGTPGGIYPLTFLVTRPGGTPHNADGYIRVFPDSIPPPPPPPPPTPAVQFAGYDSTTGQPTMTFWLVFNESQGPFDMPWSLTSARNWPNFPITGSQFLSGQEQRTVVVTIPVPDSAAVGFNRLFMTVTRPNGLPPQTAEGDLPIVP